MKDLLIRSEKLPERCEICHQTDCFDPVNNHCTRCSGLITHNSSGQPVMRTYRSQVKQITLFSDETRQALAELPAKLEKLGILGFLSMPIVKLDDLFKSADRAIGRRTAKTKNSAIIQTIEAIGSKQVDAQYLIISITLIIPVALVLLMLSIISQIDLFWIWLALVGVMIASFLLLVFSIWDA